MNKQESSRLKHSPNKDIGLFSMLVGTKSALNPPPRQTISVGTYPCHLYLNPRPGFKMKVKLKNYS